MNLQKLFELKLPELDYAATPRDVMLYALASA